MLRNNSPQERGQTFNETFHKTVQVGEAERGCEYNLNEIGHLQLTLSASYELGFNGKRLHHSTTSTCGGQSGVCYAQTRGGTVSREAVRPQTAACHPHVPPRPVLWERSHGATQATWDPRPGCGNSPLTGFSRARVKRRLQQQRGRETV